MRSTLGVDIFRRAIRSPEKATGMDGRDLWAWLDRKFVERGVGAFLQYTLEFRSDIWDEKKESFSDFTAKQSLLLHMKIEATEVTMTPDLDLMSGLWMSLPETERFTCLKYDLLRNKKDWKDMTYIGMTRQVEQFLELWKQQKER